MKILVELLHPAHLHFFKNAIHEWVRRGDEVCVFGRDKDCLNPLLGELGVRSIQLSRRSSGTPALGWELGRRLIKLAHHVAREKPDVLVGVMGVTIAPIGRLLRKPSVVFYDTEAARWTNRVAFRLANRVCVPDCFMDSVDPSWTRYPSYQELAYLHPNRFIPNSLVLDQLELRKSERYFVLRWVSLNSSHDLFQKGLGLDQKREWVKELSKLGKVLISSEAPLPDDLEPYRYKGPLSAFHDVLAHATAVIGESPTVCSEAAVLGVPAFHISDSPRGYTEEQDQRFGLVKNYPVSRNRDAIHAVQAMLLQNPESTQAEMLEKRRLLLQVKRDATQIILEQVDEVVR